MQENKFEDEENKNAAFHASLIICGNSLIQPAVPAILGGNFVYIKYKFIPDSLTMQKE
jgi:hypothetical protein